jgi:hypothetical protein
MYNCECGRTFEKAQSLNAHFSHCLVHRKGKPDSRQFVREGKMAGWEKFSKEDKSTFASKGAKRARSGRKLTSSHKEKLSLYRSKALENNELHCKWYDLNGVKVQGSWEFRFGIFLNEQKIDWRREKLKYDVHRHYTPDFFLPVYNLYIEVKGWWKTRDREKMEKVLKEHNIDIRTVSLKELEDLENGKTTILDLPRMAG